MSLEAALTAHTAALEANTAALLANTVGREQAIAAAKEATQKVTKPKETKGAADEGESAPKAAPKPAATTQPPVDLDNDPVAKSMADYLNDAGTEKERAARVAKVKDIMVNKCDGATKHSQIPEAKRKAFINTMKNLLAAGNLLVDEPAEEADDLLA